MHEWTPDTDLFAHSVIGYAIERLRLPKDPMWGAIPAADLDQALAHAVTPQGVGGLEALRLFRDVLMPACRPMDDPMNLAYVPTAPSIAATMFDLVVSASSIFGGAWEAGAGAIAAAIAEGYAAESISEAIALTANELALRDEGRPEQIGRAHV